MPRLVPADSPTGTTKVVTRPRHRIVPEDCFSLTEITMPVISPTGTHVAHLESRWIDGTRQHDLMVADIDTGQTRRLTGGPAPMFAPRWTPDGHSIFYATSDKDGMQVWTVQRDGATPVQVTTVPGGIARFEPGASGRCLYYTRHVHASCVEWRELREQFDNGVEYGHGTYQQSELWQHDLSSGENLLLRGRGRYVTSFSVSPDERRIALVTSPDEKLISNEGESALDILEIESGTLQMLPDDLWRRDARSPFAWIETPAWSPDSRRLVFRIGSDAFVPELVLADLSGPSPKLWKLARPNECHPIQLGWHPDGHRILFTASHRSAVVLVAVDADQPGAHEFLVDGDVVVETFSVAADNGRIALLQSSPESLPELHLLHPDGTAGGAITRIHAHTADWDWPTLSRFRWSAPDGTSLEGTLELPPGYTPGSTPLPLLTILHGGPNAAAEMGRMFGIRGHTAFAAKGYAVFSPNFRGSTGYGDAFLHQLVGHTNSVEITDVLSGIDALISEGIAASDRLGMMGWSYGGYLVNCLLATKRFKVASTGAGTIDMSLQFGDMDTPGHTVNLLQSFPWDDPDEYQRSSPLYGLSPGIETATLIHTGGQDARVPSAQARTLHRILHRYLHAPCQLVTYLGANHGLESFVHQSARLAWDHAWFDQYMV